jgi:hypothetical protein
MATVAQGILAGQLAAQIQALQTLAAQLQSAVANNAQIVGISLLTGATPTNIGQQVPFSVADSATMLNAAIVIISNNIATLTTQLAAL